MNGLVVPVAGTLYTREMSRETIHETVGGFPTGQKVWMHTTERSHQLMLWSMMNITEEDDPNNVQDADSLPVNERVTQLLRNEAGEHSTLRGTAVFTGRYTDDEGIDRARDISPSEISVILRDLHVFVLVPPDGAYRMVGMHNLFDGEMHYYVKPRL